MPSPWILEHWNAPLTTARPGDAARKTHLASSELTSNAGNHRENTGIQLCFQVNSFLQALGSQFLQLDARLPGWNPNLGLIPKRDSNQVLQIPKKPAWITGTPNHAESWIYRDGKASLRINENKQKPHLRQEEFHRLLFLLWKTNPSSFGNLTPSSSGDVWKWEPILIFPRKINPRERH